jgi:hypothetical protein
MKRQPIEEGEIMELRLTSRAWLQLAGLLVLGAAISVCGGDDPILQRAEEIREQGGADPGETPGISANSSSAPGQVQPTPGGNGDRGAHIPGDSEPVQASANPPVQGEGPTARISGIVQAPDGLTGPVQIMAFASDPKASRTGGHPDVAGFTTIEAPGAFSLELANGGNPVWLDAHLDLGPDLDGRPGPGEPTGFWSEGIPTTSDTGDIVLELVVRPHQGPPTAN